jgi:hypothetical protein
LSRAGALLADHLAAGLTRPLPREDAAP